MNRTAAFVWSVAILLGLAVVLYIVSDMSLDRYQQALRQCNYREVPPTLVHIRAFTGPEEVRLFVEFQRWAVPIDPPDKPAWAEWTQTCGLGADHRARSEVFLGLIQECITIDRQGSATRLRLAQVDGITFDPAVSGIFRDPDGQWCLFCGGPTVYALAEDRFVPLPNREIYRNPSAPDPHPFDDQPEIGDEQMLEAGWRRLDAEAALVHGSAFEFQWGGRPLRLEKDSACQTRILRIRPQDAGSPGPKAVLEFAAATETMTYNQARAMQRGR
jgi:hypothetical protein